jgi:CRP-like cAMP-binding protein
VRNRLLLALPPDNLSQLLPKLHAVPLPLQTNLLVPQGRIEAVHFIETGWASVVAQSNDGAQTEIGLIGLEGMVGLALIGGVDTAFAETYMQAGGTGLHMEATAFQRELEDNHALRRLLFRYNEVTYAQTAQTAACNGHHNLEQRLARWLLMAHDRTDGDELFITQESLSLMLSVYRPSVTVVAGILQRAGMTAILEAISSSWIATRSKPRPAIATEQYRTASTTYWDKPRGPETSRFGSTFSAQRPACRCPNPPWTGIRAKR